MIDWRWCSMVNDYWRWSSCLVTWCSMINDYWRRSSCLVTWCCVNNNTWGWSSLVLHYNNLLLFLFVIRRTR